MHAGGIAFALLLVALSGQVSFAGTSDPGDAGLPDGGNRSTRRRRPVADAGPAVPEKRAKPDACAELNARPQLSAEEHQRRYGCPPCPCACVHGQIICAPCAACEGFRGKDPSLLDLDLPPKQPARQPRSGTPDG